MTLASSPDCLFRPEDKALRMLFPSIEDPLPNTFDEYLNGDLYALSDDGDNKDGYTDIEDFFQSQQLNSGSRPLSPRGGSSIRERSSPQPWRKGLWCLNQGRGSSEIVIEKRRHSEYRTYEAVKKPGLLHNNSLATSSPISPPGTPSHLGTNKAITNPRTAKARQSPYVRQTFCREATLSPSPVYAQLPHNGSMPCPETWQQDFQNFHLQVPHDKLPISPPLSGSVPHPQASARQINAAVMAQNATAVRYAGHSTAACYNAIDPGLLNPSNTAHDLPLLTSPYEQASEPPHHYAQMSHQPVPVWVSEDLESSNSSQYPYDTSATLVNSGQGQTWWSPHTGDSSSQIRVPHHEYYLNIAAPTPQRLPHQVLHQSSETNYGGLGIHYGDLVHSALPDLPPSSVIMSPPSHPMTSYPPLPPPPHPLFTQTDPFSTPRHQRHGSPSPSPPPSISPTNTSRSLRQRSPTRTDYAHSRRKSLHKSGPIKDRENTNSSKPPRTPRTPKTPTNGASGFDFVNFTPKDSVKLLSDVAPSGSSKTRARREAEAKDKRKRLSEAAVRAVRRAGGDVTALGNAILT